MEGYPVLFYIGSFGVTSVITTMVGITLLLTIISFIISRNIKMVPGRLQNAFEMVIAALQNLLSDMMGEKAAKKYFPLFATLFIFILLSNYCGLLPFAGELPGLAAPTSSLSVPVALAILVFICTHYFGLKEKKLHYFKHFFTPIAFLFPLFLIDEFIRPLSLSLRLFGNITGEETITQQFFDMVPLVLPLVPQLFSLFMGLIQAFVFMLLASVYIGSAVGHDEL